MVEQIEQSQCYHDNNPHSGCCRDCGNIRFEEYPLFALLGNPYIEPKAYCTFTKKNIDKKRL